MEDGIICMDDSRTGADGPNGTLSALLLFEPGIEFGKALSVLIVGGFEELG